MTGKGCFYTAVLLVGGTFALINGCPTPKNPYAPDMIPWETRTALQKACADSMHEPAMTMRDGGSLRGFVTMKDHRTCYTEGNKIDHIEK